MVLFIILAAVVLLAVVVVGYLFYTVNKEAAQDTQKAVAITNLSEFKKSFVEQSQESVYQKRVAQLEQELQTNLQEAKEQSQKALDTIEGLREENEQLKSERHTQAMTTQANAIKAQETIESMREEQSNLQNQLSESQAHIHRLEEEMALIQKQMAQETIQGKAQADQLIIENQTLKAASHDLTLANQKLQELNNPLMEKSELLQWDLTKARAQMTSFERACENYQHQLQDVLTRTGSMQEDHTRLSETNNRLQSVLGDLQKQNEELTKREKLFEFELQKSRTQLVSLERVYENLKANMLQPNPSSQE
ncbi:MAG: hypothetical protein HY209_04975 [Candidatus Omnitrophica bacterium]|nr:hypothetical protein [Candidatus Omnitrophota bacterium]